MSKDALRVAQSGNFTHVIDQWTWEVNQNLWDAVIVGPDEPDVTHYVCESLRMPRADERLDYDMQPGEIDFLAGAVVAVVTTAPGRYPTVRYFDDEDTYKLECAPLIEASEQGQFVAKLEALAEQHADSTLYGDVVRDVIEAEKEGYGRGYIKNVLSHGCRSGIVTKLIYNTDCRKWYVEHLDEIDDLLDELQDEAIEIKLQFPLATHLSWLAYDETMRRIAYDLGIEI